MDRSGKRNNGSGCQPAVEKLHRDPEDDEKNKLPGRREGVDEEFPLLKSNEL